MGAPSAPPEFHVIDRLRRLAPFARSRTWWAVVLVAALGAEALALWYQYALGEEPCVLCIELRLWVAGFVLVGAAGVVLPPRPAIAFVLHGLGVVLGLGMLSGAWETWATENRIADGSCAPFLNLPEWFAVGRWFPAVFEVRGLCGYTPDVILGLSMADLLLAGAFGALLATIAFLGALLAERAQPVPG